MDTKLRAAIETLIEHAKEDIEIGTLSMEVENSLEEAVSVVEKWIDEEEDSR